MWFEKRSTQCLDLNLCSRNQKLNHKTNGKRSVVGGLDSELEVLEKSDFILQRTRKRKSFRNKKKKGFHMSVSVYRGGDHTETPGGK